MSYKSNYVPNRVLNNSNILPQIFTNTSTFDLSEDLKTTIKFDGLYPVYWEELNPADHFEVKVSTLGRLMPLVAPNMSNMRIKYFAFFVPNRLLWKNWTKFMGEKQYQDTPTEFIVPQLKLKGDYTQKLPDYMGVPYVPGKEPTVSALPFRAYRKIYNDWFRANELQAPLEEFTDDTGELENDAYVDSTYLDILKKGKPLDYFTSCLPYPQAGEQVAIPLAGQAVVRTTTGQTNLNVLTPSGTKYGYLNSPNAVPDDVTGFSNLADVTYGNDTHLYADMSEVSGISINALRQASALQVLLENDAKAGETYIDLMNRHYGTTVPDFLVGRTQFLGSTTTALNVEPIAQMSATTSETPQGNLAGVGVGQDSDFLCEVSAVEHGIFMILASVEGDVSYQQGLPRKFSKLGRYDYMFPEFWNLGDQAVLNKEIYLTGDPAKDEAVFGYQERYRELREGVSKVSGLMRSSHPQSLDSWHLAQKFENLPQLNEEFITSSTPIDRAMALPEEDHVLLNTYFDIKATRALPVASNPSLVTGRV